jgi:hypothetical protein
MPGHLPGSCHWPLQGPGDPREWVKHHLSWSEDSQAQGQPWLMGQALLIFGFWFTPVVCWGQAWKPLFLKPGSVYPANRGLVWMLPVHWWFICESLGILVEGQGPLSRSLL